MSEKRDFENPDSRDNHLASVKRSAMLMGTIAFLFLSGTSFGAILFHYHSRGSTLRDGLLRLADWGGTWAFLLIAIPFGLSFAVFYYFVTKLCLNRPSRWQMEIEILLAASISLLCVTTLVFALPIICN